MKVPNVLAKSRNPPAFRGGCHEREKYTTRTRTTTTASFVICLSGRAMTIFIRRERKTLQILLFEHGNLALVFASATAGATGGADDCQNCQGFERGARYKDTLGVRALIGRVDEIAFRHVLS